MSDALAPDALILPPALRRVLPAARWERVTDGESGAGVWRSTRFVVKVQPRTLYPASTLLQERERLRWFAGRLPVPQVVAYEDDGAQEYLAMTRLPGIPMSHPDAALHPERMVNLLARALRELHALPVRECPFNMSLGARLKLARERVAAGAVDESDFDEERQGHSAVSVFNRLARTRPAQEDLVVTHGDACLPNFIVQGGVRGGTDRPGPRRNRRPAHRPGAGVAQHPPQPGRGLRRHAAGPLRTRAAG